VLRIPVHSTTQWLVGGRCVMFLLCGLRRSRSRAQPSWHRRTHTGRVDCELIARPHLLCDLSAHRQPVLFWQSLTASRGRSRRSGRRPPPSTALRRTRIRSPGNRRIVVSESRCAGAPIREAQGHPFGKRCRRVFAPASCASFASQRGAGTSVSWTMLSIVEHVGRCALLIDQQFPPVSEKDF
jgi:hypothetical protein